MADRQHHLVGTAVYHATRAGRPKTGVITAVDVAHLAAHVRYGTDSYDQETKLVDLVDKSGNALRLDLFG